MVKNKGKRVMAKLIGMKRTSVWLTKEQQELAKNCGVTNQEFAQRTFDLAMSFVVSINMETGKRTVLDYEGEDLSDADKKLLAKAFVKEYLRTLPKEGEGE